MDNLTTPNAESGAHEIVLENLESVLEMGNIVTKNAKYIQIENSAADFEEDMKDNELALSIRKLLDRSYIYSSSAFSIFHITESVHKFNEGAYRPRLVRISPHFMNKESVFEKGLKTSYCKKLIDRSKNSLEVIIKHLEERQLSVLSCYDGPDISGPMHVPVILFNACFIIEYLIRSYNPRLREPGDDEPSMQVWKTVIKRDLVLLKNQLPYFILESLFKLIDPFSSSQWNERSPEFSELVMSFFKEYNKYDDVHPDFRYDFSYVKHFTDLIRTLHQPKMQTPDPRYPDFEFTASAKQLHDAGVEFKMVSGKCLLDIDFKDHYLELPRFELNDDQESLYRNLMALELRLYPYNTFIIDYFVFMDTLINTSDDINILVRAGVLVNRIGDYQDAANTFNKFCAGITTYNVARSYLLPLFGKLNAYYKKPKNTWMTTFKRDYFGTPLRTASTIAAVSLVGLTLISTVCSIISVA